MIHFVSDGNQNQPHLPASVDKTIKHNWHEDGGGLIVPTEYGFVLYEVPQYGGEPCFVGHFKTLDEAKKKVEELT